MSTYAMPRLNGLLRRDDVDLTHLQPASELIDSANVRLGGDVVDLRKWCSPVEDQSQLGSCSANAGVGNLEFLEIRAGQPYVDLSRMFVYYNARWYDGTTGIDSGAYIMSMMKTLESMGVCAEVTWPYDIGRYAAQPHFKAVREGYVHRIRKHLRVGSGRMGDVPHDEIEALLRIEQPIIFGMTVDEAYSRSPGSGLVDMPASSRVKPGAHAQLIVGADFDRKLYIVRNSWGADWGDGGYVYVPFAYLDASDAAEFATAVRLA